MGQHQTFESMVGLRWTEYILPLPIMIFTILIYDEERNVILIAYRETIKTEDVKEQKTN